MLEYIYICRHGFRSNWVDPTIKTGPTGMNRDAPLAPYGHEQAAQLATFLSSPSHLDPHPIPEKVFSSPFYRSIETAIPTYRALEQSGHVKGGISLEHGVQEWYSHVRPNTGLHPRPAGPSSLVPLFPPGSIDQSYTSTYYPPRRGENLREAQDRADTFIETWTGRLEEEGVKSVVVFGHAASVILLGRALTGDKTLNVPAPSASCSLYRRKPRQPSNGMPNSRSTSSLSAARTLLEMSQPDPSPAQAEDDSSLLRPCGVGEWDAVWLGRTDYLKGGSERDWSFRDIHLVNGEVVDDNGDAVPHPPEDAIPTGLASGMERYLRRGLPPPNGLAFEQTGQKP